MAESTTPHAKTGNHDVGTRLQALALLEMSIPVATICDITGISESAIYRLRTNAKTRGYNPQQSKRLVLAYIQDAPRSGRPIKATQEVKKSVVETISKNSTTRQLSTQAIIDCVNKSLDIKISARTTYNILKSQGYGYFKPTYKPGLTREAKAIRLKWCLDHKDWTLEDWKNVIWSDETAVTMGGQRGRIRVWRLQSEAYNQHCIRRRWKGFKQFMFWGCFSYDKKGPCHIWEDETEKEKKESIEWIIQKNKELEPIARTKWELENGIHRLRITRQLPGKKPTWKWSKRTGKLERRSKSAGGIDWYRYMKLILEKKLLPFALECKEDRPNTIVQEDNATPHAYHYQQEVYNTWGVQRLLWPPNSPDLNAIEPPWMHIKKQTTRGGAVSSQKKLKKDWIECWDTLEQVKIQAWIERILIHIQDVIRLEGGNE